VGRRRRDGWACHDLDVIHSGEKIEIAYGGLVEWTQSLVGSNNERLMITGLRLERVATVAPQA
jgi:hypothetical protein